MDKKKTGQPKMGHLGQKLLGLSPFRLAPPRSPKHANTTPRSLLKNSLEDIA